MDENLPMEKQVLLYKKYLERYIERPDAEEKVLYILHKLQKMEITLDILADTGIGKLVNKYRKKGPALKDKVKTVITKWRALIPPDDDSPPRDNAEDKDEGGSTEVSVKTEKISPAESDCEQNTSMNSPRSIKSEPRDCDVNKVKKERGAESSDCDESAYSDMGERSAKVKVKQESSEAKVKQESSQVKVKYESSQVKAKPESSKVKVKQEKGASGSHKSRSSDYGADDSMKVKRERTDVIVKQENDSGMRENTDEKYQSSSSRSSESNHSHSSQRNHDKNSHSSRKSKSHPEKHRKHGNEREKSTGRSKHDEVVSHNDQSSSKLIEDAETPRSKNSSHSSEHNHKRCKYCGKKKRSGHECCKDREGEKKSSNQEESKRQKKDEHSRVEPSDVVDDDSWWDAPADEDAPAVEDAPADEDAENSAVEAGGADIDDDGWWDAPIAQDEDEEEGIEARTDVDVDDDAWWDATPEGDKDNEVPSSSSIQNSERLSSDTIKSSKHHSSSSSKSHSSSSKHKKDSHKTSSAHTRDKNDSNADGSRSRKSEHTSQISAKDKKDVDSKTSHKSSQSSDKKKDHKGSKSVKDEKHRHKEKKDEKGKEKTSKESRHHSSSRDKRESSKDKSGSSKDKSGSSKDSEKSSKRKIEEAANDGGFSFEDFMSYDGSSKSKKAKLSGPSEPSPTGSGGSTTTKPSTSGERSHSKTESRSSSSKHHKSHKSSHSVNRMSAESEPKASGSSQRTASTSPDDLDLDNFSVPKPDGKVKLTKEDLLTPPPDINPNYKPLPRVDLDDTPIRRKAVAMELSAHEVLESIGVKKNERTVVFSGKKRSYLQTVPTLLESCLQVLSDNLDALDHVGMAPYYLLQPVLQKATPEQLYSIEDCNPQFLGETEELWQTHCGKDFRAAQREDMESWRELYLRQFDEREEKLKRLKANISAATQARQAPVRKTKLAYVDAPVKPPRNVRRMQQRHGTAGPMGQKDPLSKLSSHGGQRQRPPVPTMPGPSRRKEVKLVAPMMQKTLKFMKNLQRL